MENSANNTEVKEIQLLMQRDERITIPAQHIEDVSIQQFDTLVHLTYGENESSKRFFQQIPSADIFKLVVSSLMDSTSDHYVPTNTELLTRFPTADSYIEDRLFSENTPSKEFFGHGLDIIAVTFVYANGSSTDIFLNWDDPNDVYTHSRQTASIENGRYFLSQSPKN